MAEIKEKKAELAKRKIVESAIVAFARKGYSGASLQEIADNAGVAQTAILYHFKSKLGLFEAILSVILVTNRTFINELPTDDAWTRLTKYFMSNFHWAINHADQVQNILMLYYMSSYDPHFSDIYLRIKTGAQERILSSLLAGVREKIFELPRDPKDVASAVHALVIGEIVNFVTDRDIRQKSESALRVEQSVQRSLAHLTGYRGIGSAP